jgi:hypothetical protein
MALSRLSSSGRRAWLAESGGRNAARLSMNVLLLSSWLIPDAMDVGPDVHIAALNLADDLGPAIDDLNDCHVLRAS